jgi:acetoin utilization deacetylase AcuC-like enzyme
MCDLAVSTEGFRRCGRAVAALDRPLVVLQEGGYADDALGANVAAWLTGVVSSP